MEGYKVTVTATSREFTKKELIRLKDTSAATSLDALTKEAEKDGNKVILNPADYVQLEIHNEKSENKDYSVAVVIDKSGESYVTGSEAFITSFLDIWNEMQGEEESWGIEVYRRASKNFNGSFITCTII